MGDFGKKPELKWIPTIELAIDESYQRSMETRASQRLVRSIEAHFRWSQFAALLVAVSDDHPGYYMVLDGQHRLTAAQLLGISEVPCVVVEAASRVEQAQSFLHANRDRIAVSQFALYHASVMAGDPRAVELAKLMKDCDCVIPRYQLPKNLLKPNHVVAIRQAELAIARNGPARAREVFRSLRLGYPNEFSMHAYLVQGISRLLEAKPEVTQEQLVALFSRLPMAALLGIARTRYIETALPRWTAVKSVVYEMVTGVSRRAPAGAPRVSLTGALDADRTIQSRDQLSR